MIVQNPPKFLGKTNCLKEIRKWTEQSKVQNFSNMEKRTMFIEKICASSPPTLLKWFDAKTQDPFHWYFELRPVEDAGGDDVAEGESAGQASGGGAGEGAVKRRGRRR